MSEADVPFEQRRFRTAAAHYLAGRPPYAAGLIARVAEMVGLGPADRVMDLGCGPGQLARAFAPRAGAVVALDPEPEMLAIAESLSAEFPTITWHRASSDDLSPSLGNFKLVCIGRAFHWMDREETLRRLDHIIVPGGAIAIFRDHHPDVPDNEWYRRFLDVLLPFREDRPLGRARHEGVLLASRFSRLEEISVYERPMISADVLVARALSMSTTSRARLGERADTMVAALRSALPAGEFPEVVCSRAMVAWRA